MKIHTTFPHGIKRHRWLLVTISLFVLVGCSPQSGLFSEASPSPSNTVLSDETIQGSLQDLVSLNQPLQCTFISNAQEDTQTSGQVYINNNAFRVNSTFIATQASPATESSPSPAASPIASPVDSAQAHVIGDSEWVYIWQENEDQGFRAQPDAIQNVTSQLQELTDESDQRSALLGLLDSTDFTCTSWDEVDESLFTPPESVEFTDVSIYLRALELQGGN